MSSVYPTGASLLTPVKIRTGWEIVDVQWFTPGIAFGPLPVYFGCVLTLAAHAGHKAYLGIGVGLDLETDLRMIAEYGAKLDPLFARRFWPDVANWATT